MVVYGHNFRIRRKNFSGLFVPCLYHVVLCHNCHLTRYFDIGRDWACGTRFSIYINALPYFQTHHHARKIILGRASSSISQHSFDITIFVQTDSRKGLRASLYKPELSTALFSQKIIFLSEKSTRKLLRGL